MKLFGSLSALVILFAVFAASPTIVSAQTLSPASAMAPSSAPAPALYAELDRANTFSSSAVADAPAAGSASFAGAAPAKAANTGSTRPFSSVGVGVTVGLGGIGFQLATPLVPGRLNVRGGAGFLSYTYNGTVSNEPVSATLKLNNGEIMVDLFPFKGSFRLSAGTTFYNKTGLNGTVSVAPGTTLKIGNDTYISAQAPNQLNGTLSAGFGGTAVPRFTLGWGNMVARNHHIRFETEFGVEIIGTPTVSWTYGGEACQAASGSSTTCAAGTTYTAIASVPGASADIASQTADLQSDINSLKVFPILEFGLSYKIGH